MVWLWDVLFWMLIHLAPKVFKGTSGAYEHGRKSRKWAYKIWKNTNTTAVASRRWGELDDDGCAWAKGFFYYDKEENEPPEELQILHSMREEPK